MMLPQSTVNPELKLKHIMHDDPALCKSALIYSLIALMYEQKHICLNMPIGSPKLI